MAQPSGSIQITLIPADGNERDADWQDECQRLVSLLRSDLKEYGADVAPLELPATGPGSRGLAAVSFSSFAFLAQSEALAAALPHAWDVLKKWLSPRPGVKGKITIKDGDSEYTIEDLSKDEWLKILEQRGVLRRPVI